MRTTAGARGRGVATLMLRHILEDARARNLERLYLETGTEDYFAPARRLYVRNGFTECPPFAGYALDPNSVLWEHPNVLISPHTAALSTQETTRIARLFAYNATRILDGQTVRNKVDTVEFY